MKLDKKSFVPLYYQLADLLRKEISDGGILPGTLFPSENELMRSYRISRGTVREALRILEHEGLIERRKGIGTFVCEPKIEHETDRVFGFTRVMQMSGKRASARVIEVCEFDAPSFICEKMGLPHGAQVVLVKRLRYADNEPLLLEHSYFRHDVGEKLLEEDLTHSIYLILEEKYQYKIWRSDNTIEAQLAEKEEANYLDAKIGSPLLVLKRLVYLDDDTVFEYAKDIYRADRTKFVIHAHLDQMIEKSVAEHF